MSYAEEESVYAIQCGLRAIKQCAMCGTWLVVTEFGFYGVQPCADCTREQRRKRSARWR